VSSKTVEKGRAVYAALGVPNANIVFEDHSGPAARAGHSWVTKNFGGKCSANKAPYINDCAYDQAGAELKAIYGLDLNPPAAAPSGRIVSFDQTEFVSAGARANGLSDTGYLYVPKDCEPGASAPCRLHVVLHGCTQSSEALGAEFYTKIGVNEWGDSNRIVVLYPQAHATTVAELPPQAGLTAAIDANPYWLLELVGICRGSTVSDEKWRPDQRHLGHGATDRRPVTERLPSHPQCRHGCTCWVLHEPPAPEMFNNLRPHRSPQVSPSQKLCTA
jgi:hypothetical protein